MAERYLQIIEGNKKGLTIAGQAFFTKILYERISSCRIF